MNNISFGSLKFADSFTKNTITDIMIRDEKSREVVSNALEQIDLTSGQDEFVLSANEEIRLAVPGRSTSCIEIGVYNQSEERLLGSAELDGRCSFVDIKRVFDGLVDAVQKDATRKDIEQSLDKYV